MGNHLALMQGTSVAIQDKEKEKIEKGRTV